MMARRSKTLLVLALLVGVPLTGAFVLRQQTTLVALSAPRASSGMTLFLVTDESVLDRLGEGGHVAEYRIFFGDKLVYPTAGSGESFRFEGRTASAFIPYDLFVVGNGEYDVVVTLDGKESRARVGVDKWVDYVYLHPFDKGSVIVVEAALASGTGGRPEDRVLASGELILEMRYRGTAGEEDRPMGSVTTYTRNDQPTARVDVPRSRFSAGPGYYSFEPRFHNDEARNNLQVGPDPTMRYYQPPFNWVYIPPGL